MGIMCEFNRRTGLQPTLLNDCDICKEKYCMPRDSCCLHECGEHEFCRNCTHGIYQNTGNETGFITGFDIAKGDDMTLTP